MVAACIVPSMTHDSGEATEQVGWPWMVLGMALFIVVRVVEDLVPVVVVLLALRLFRVVDWGWFWKVLAVTAVGLVIYEVFKIVLFRWYVAKQVAKQQADE